MAFSGNCVVKNSSMFKAVVQIKNAKVSKLLNNSLDLGLTLF